MRFSNDTGKYVAHYTRLDIAVDHILKNKSLRFGPLIATNDPRETQMWQFAIGTSRSKENSPFSEKLKLLAKRNPDYNRLLKGGCKILCVSQDEEDALKLDFSKRACGKPRMWAQYAENHRGVCLLFDKHILHETLEKNFGRDALFCGSVAYDNFHDIISPGWPEHMNAFMLSGDDIAADGLENILRRHRDKYHDFFFFRKNKDWASETEYRWIVRVNSNDPVFIPRKNS
ncbi:MAG: DUF2971 domain-containing protein [Desulfobacterales bacterium]|jgi:hypothetical protein